MNFFLRSLALVAALLLPACGGGGGSSSVPGPQPDFSLLDVNTASPTSGLPVSPRDYLGLVAGIYFGHAT